MEQFLYLILSVYDRKFAGYDRLFGDDNITFDFCSTFTSFGTLLKIIGKSLTIHFSDVLQKLAELHQNQKIYWFYEASSNSSRPLSLLPGMGDSKGTSSFNVPFRPLYPELHTFLTSHIKI